METGQRKANGVLNSELGTQAGTRSPKAILGFISVIGSQLDMSQPLPNMIQSCWCHSPNGRAQNVTDKQVGFPVGADADTVSCAVT